MNKKTRKIVFWSVLMVVIASVLYGAIIIVKSVPSHDQIVLTQPVNDTDWSRGPKDAKVTIVEYSDLQCPACAYFNPIIEDSVAKLNSQSVRFVYRHFPLSQHQNARNSIHYAEAAGKQGKFFEMSREMFANQKDWENLTDPSPEFIKYAGKLGLNIAQLKIDAQSPAIESKINSDLLSGLDSGVHATPTFFINDKQVDMPPQDAAFLKIIQDYLAK